MSKLRIASLVVWIMALTFLPLRAEDLDVRGYDSLGWGDSIETVKKKLNRKTSIREKGAKTYLDFRERKDGEDYEATALFVDRNLISVTLYKAENDRYFSKEQADQLVKSYIARYGKPVRIQSDAQGHVVDWRFASGHLHIGLGAKPDGAYRPYISYRKLAEKSR